MGHLPIFSDSIPRGILAMMAVKDKRLIIIPSSKAAAPFCVMYKGRMGSVVSVARNVVMDVAVRR